MYDQIKNILVDELGLNADTVTPEARLADTLGITSLEFLNAVMAIEDTYNVSTDENKLKSIETVNDLVLYIDELCKAS